MEQLLLWIQTYGIPAIIALIALEYACFPISSELVLPFAGFFGAGAGIFLPLLILYSTIAGLVGTSLVYACGRCGGSVLTEKLMERFPSTKKPILASYRTFGNHGNSAVCFGRMIPICRTYIAFIAGVCRQPYLSYLLYSAIGITLWNSVLLTLGYYFYGFRHTFFLYFNRWKTILLVIGLLLLFLIFVTRKKGDEEE
jgi:membrane protein DedA with SNARE-associated domain